MLRSIALGVGKEFIRRGDLNDRAFIHKHNQIRSRFGKAHLMGYQKHRHSAFGELEHYVQHLLDHLRIKGGSRFIKEHYLWLHRKGSGDRNTLLLSAGELRRMDIRFLLQPDELEKIHRFLGCLFLGELPNFHRREGDVLQSGEVWKEVKGLEYHPHFLSDRANIDPLSGHFFIIDEDPSAGRLFQFIDRAKQG